jgi:hypothetical protein
MGERRGRYGTEGGERERGRDGGMEGWRGMREKKEENDGGCWG